MVRRVVFLKLARGKVLGKGEDQKRGELRDPQVLRE